jgi:hypothetical protein
MKTALIAAVLIITGPLAADAAVNYGAWYYTPAPYNQPYYQPMSAYAYAPAQNTTIYQPNYQYQPQYQSMSYPQYGYQNYGYGYPNYQNYSYYPQNYGSYGYQAQPSPVHPGYPTGETMPWLGGELCTFPGYEGRAICGSNPRQYVYDHWTGTWY